MQAEVIHPDTGEVFTIEIPALRSEDLDSMKKEYSQDEQLKSHLEALPVSAEVKAMLFKLSKFTIKLGESVLRFGKRVLEIAIMLANKYKHATFGLILAALLTSLIGTIVWIGPLLASFLGPFLMAIGLGKGLWEDLKKDSPQLAASITEAGTVFSPLASATTTA
jgi:hypothetical protein